MEKKKEKRRGIVGEEEGLLYNTGGDNEWRRANE
jgi:hypothetical protein